MPAAEDMLPEDDRALRDFKRSHRQMRRNWDLPSKFPDIRVIDAYRKVCMPNLLQIWLKAA